jgi:hypothetical protein
MQILYTDNLVQIEDWSALLDTSHAVAWVSAVLLIVTIILNAVTLIVCCRREKQAPVEEFNHRLNHSRKKSNTLPLRPSR